MTDTPEALRPTTRELVGLFVALLAGVVLLYGRYDWRPDWEPYSWRSYLLAAYLFVFTFSTLLFLLRTVVRGALPTRPVAGAVFIILTLPHAWLGLRPHYYYVSHKLMEIWTDAGPPRNDTDWFPEAFKHFPTIPGEVWLFGGLLLVGGTIIYHATREERMMPPRPWALVVWVLILLQAWMHLSLRSPYTYVPHFEKPPEAGYWYHAFLFDAQRGAVNLDYRDFYRVVELLFYGDNMPVAPIMQRAFPTYLGSQFSAFFNTFHVWICINCAAWFLTVCSVYYLGAALYSRRVALFAALLATSAQGVILYVAQAKIYAFAACAVAMLVALFHFVFSRRDVTYTAALGFGSFFGLMLLSYEGQPWFIALPIMALILRAPWRKVLVSLVFGLAISQGFMMLCRHVPNLSIASGMTSIAGDPIANIIDLVKNVRIRKILMLTDFTARGYLDCLAHAFQFAFVVALLGFIPAFKRWSKEPRKFMFAMMVPSFLTFAVFQYGENSYYLQFPRLVFSAYPAVYLLGALGLAAIEAKWSTTWAKVSVWGLLALNFIYLNSDVWGWPVIYYAWFYRNTGYTMGAPRNW